MKIAKWILLIIGLGIIGGGARIAFQQKEKQTSQYPIADSIYKHLQKDKTKRDTVISLFGPKKPKEQPVKEETITIERNGLPPIRIIKSPPETLEGGFISESYGVSTPGFPKFPKTNNPDYKDDEDRFKFGYSLGLDMVMNGEGLPVSQGYWYEYLEQGVWLLYYKGDLYFKGHRINKKRLAKLKFRNSLEQYNKEGHSDPNIIKAFKYLESLADKLPDDSVKPDSEKTIGEKYLKMAKSYLGVPYVWGGRSRKGLDCLGIMFLSYTDLTGNDWHSLSVYPSKLIKSGKLGKPVEGLDGVLRENIDYSKLKKGDIIYFLVSYKVGNVKSLVKIKDKKFWVWHTAIYAGDTLVIHAKPEDKVVIENMKNIPFEAIYVTRLREK